MDATSIDLTKLIPLLIPIILLQVGLQIAALVNLYRQPASNIKGNKWLWAAIIVVGEIFGPVVYFLLARRES